jgi:hypothetical protein
MNSKFFFKGTVFFMQSSLYCLQRQTPPLNAVEHFIENHGTVKMLYQPGMYAFTSRGKPAT